MRHVLFDRILPIAILLCLAGAAFAGPADAGTPAQSAALWAPLIASGLMLVAFLIRRFAPDVHWLHDPAGAIAIALFVGALGAVADALRAGWSLTNLIPALTSFVTSFIATANPSADGQGGIKSGTAKMLLPFLLISGVALSGCAALQKCQDPKQAAFNPGCKVLDIVVSCGAPDVVKALGTLVLAVTPAIVGNTIDWGALGTLEKAYGTDALMCALQEALKVAGGLGDPPLGFANVYKALRASPDSVKKNVAEVFAQRHVVVLAIGGTP